MLMLTNDFETLDELMDSGGCQNIFDGHFKTAGLATGAQRLKGLDLSNKVFMLYVLNFVPSFMA